MKKQTLVVTILAGILVSPVALAADGVTEPIKAETNSTVLFKADDSTDPGVVDPTDPDNPGGEVDPESDGEKGNGNKSFNIAWVSNFKFNEVDENGKLVPIVLNANGMDLWAKGTKLIYTPENGAAVTKENIPNFVQVVDNRGKLTGWNLKVTNTPFKGTAEGSQEEFELKGAELSLNNPHLVGPTGVEKPEIFANDKLVITDAPAKVMTADPTLDENTGTGSWSLNFGDTKSNKLVEGTGVNLNIPASASIRSEVTYTSNLTWTLEDTPNN